MFETNTTIDGKYKVVAVHETHLCGKRGKMAILNWGVLQTDLNRWNVSSLQCAKGPFKVLLLTFFNLSITKCIYIFRYVEKALQKIFIVTIFRTR